MMCISNPRHLITVALTVVVLFVGLSAVQSTPVQAASPNIVISQIYGGGGNSGATLKNDFIELFNRGTTSVNISGWSVQYASSTGSSWQKTDLSGTLQSGQYYLIQEAAGSGGTVNLPTPDASASIAMSATGAKLALVNNNTFIASGTISPTGSSIIDFVGWDGANFYETAAAPATSNTTAILRNNKGCTEPDNNSPAFAAAAPTPRNAASAAHYCTGPTNPTGIGSSNPASVFAGNTSLLTVAVTPGNFPPSTGLAAAANLSTIGGSATQALYDNGTNGDAVANDNTFSYLATVNAATTPGAKSLAATITDAQSRSGSTTIALTVKAPPISIHTIQGATHISPKNSQPVTTLPSVVTALRTTGSTRGFYIQDPNPDTDPATSEGIFVFTGSTSNPASLVAVGDSVQVSGTVSEYRPSTDPASLTLTELTSPSVTKLSSGNPLPAPVVLGTGGRVPPNMVIEDDATGDVETSGVFDPATDGIDYYESLEGMLVQVNDAVAVGPTSNFTSNREIPIVGNNGANAGVRTYRGGIVIRANDYNPERIILNDWITGGPTLPFVNVGAGFPGTLVGVIDYSFDNYKLQVISMPTVNPGSLTPETAAVSPSYQLAIGTFNVENLAPSDPSSKFTTLASLFVNNLRAPDIVAIEEIQDNTGATDDGIVDASTTWGKLITAIQAAGGPTYAYRQINPVNDQDGGATGGNIRQGFLFRADRGVVFVDRPGGTSTNATSVLAGPQLSFSPGRIDPTNTAFNTSRKPLAGEFTFKGDKVFVIANHFNSKGGDQPLFGHLQPPVFSSEVQRNQQAQIVNGFANSILTADPNANIVVLGDINDFQFSSPLTKLKGSILTDLIETLPQDHRYSYVYEGNSETLDHILINNGLAAKPFGYQVVHVNSEFWNQSSDHEPQVARLCVDHTAPTISVSASPNELWPANHKYVTVKTTVNATDNADPNPKIELASVTSSEPDNGLGDGDTANDIVKVNDYTFDLRAERSGTGPGRVYTITYKVTDACGNSTQKSATVTVPHDKGNSK
jgi:predicted extracellular nuclease